jgi:hypothetical protein
MAENIPYHLNRIMPAKGKVARRFAPPSFVFPEV